LARSDFWSSRLPALLSIIILIVFAVAIWQAQGFPARAKAFPLFIAWPMVVLAVVQLGMDIFKPKKHAGPSPSMAMGMATGSVPSDLGQAQAQPTASEENRLSQLRQELDELADLEDAEVQPHTRQDVIIALAWFFSFFVLIWLIGMRIGIPLYTAIYLFVVSKERWWGALLGGAAAYAFIYFIFDEIGHLPFFPGELIKMLGLD
jgi:hypothetical protein